MRATVDLNNLAVFVRVVEAQSFTAAAKALGVPKSTVSRRVAQLEEALGVRLLQRTTRKLSLTDAGHAYHERASVSLAGIEEANAAVSDMVGTPRGTVRLTAPVDLGVAVLADLVARFTRRHPGIHVELVLTARTVDLVEEGIDLAVRAGPLRDSSLVARRIGSSAARLYASRAYLQRRGTPSSAAELSTHDCVLFRPRGGKARWQLAGPGGVEAVEVTGPIGADDFAFVHRALLAGAGIGLVPTFLCEHDVRRGRLVNVLPDHATQGGVLHVVYPSARHVPQRVALLRDFLVEGLSVLRATR